MNAMISSLSNRLWPASAPLATVLKAGAIVAGAEGKTPNSNGLPELLHTRLEKFDEALDESSRSRPTDLQSLQLDTAFASLYVLERVHTILAIHDAEYINETSTPPLIGMRDMAQLRTNLSIVFNWGTELLFTRILPSLPNRPSRSPRIPPDAHIIDLTATFEDLTHLFDILNRLLTMILPDGPQGPSSTTFVAMAVLSRGFTELLRACICLAWLPSELRGELPPELELDFKSYVLRLLNGSHPAQSITSLGLIMRKHGQRPWYMAKECTRLSTEQLLRPAGIAGLFSSVFGEDLTSTEAPLEKLEMVSKLLTNVPPRMPPEIYYPMMIPRLLHLLSPSMDQKTPSSHKRAAAFGLSRMLLSRQNDKEESAPDIRVNVINWCLLDSFIPASQADEKPTTDKNTSSTIGTCESTTNPVEKAHSIATNALVLTPSSSILTLSTIFLNTDPSPLLIGLLLQPIASRLYTLLDYLRESRTADPTLRETTEGLLGIWARAAGRTEVVDALWDIVEGRAGEWGVDEVGELHVTERSLKLPSLTLAQFADLQEGKLETEENEESNPLSLSPHPLHFAQFLKSLNRNDISSALYLRILDAHVLIDNEDDPLRKLLLFKLSMQMSAQLGSDAEADSPLKRPDATRMLMFIKMSLAQDEALRGSKAERVGKLSLESLRLVPEEDGGAGEDGDSDDEDLAPGLEGIRRSEHLSVTAVNLLLALLEEHPDLSPRTMPLLNEIYTQLEPLANSASEALRPRAREARITLTARIASTDILPRKESNDELGEESSQEKYQRALKLLQDPLLPVRGHGLLLLRELVAPAKNISGLKKGKKSGVSNAASAIVSTVQGAEVAAAPLDAALMPAILSIFMQSIQDEDSYIFLNSVQGLAAMVDGFGRDVLRGLVEEYAKGLEGVGGSSATMTTRELDKRVRVGEALGQIIKRCGSTLVNYVDLIVPRVFAIVRASHLPTTLRTSAVSLLATTADTSTLALGTYTPDLVSAMINLVQMESVKAKPRSRPAAAATVSPVPDSPNIAEKQTNRDYDDVIELRPRRKEKPINGTESGDRVANQIGTSENDTMNGRPTAANSKFPPLRRAALHFMSLLIRALTESVYEGDGINCIPPGPEMKQALSVLGYVSATDEDEVVRVMAREASEHVEQLQRALLGL